MSGFEIVENADALKDISKELHQKVFKDIQSYALSNGSRVETRSLEKFSKLSESQRRRLFARFENRTFRRIATQMQYKLVWDKVDDELYLVEK